MHEEELLQVYLDKLAKLSLEKLHERKISALQALKEALNCIEGEMRGY